MTSNSSGAFGISRIAEHNSAEMFIVISTAIMQNSNMPGELMRFNVDKINYAPSQFCSNFHQLMKINMIRIVTDYNELRYK